jgi:hypothetical protein
MATGRINRDWHAANPMPKAATFDQRLAWHVAHARHCGCRDMPNGIRAELVRRGVRPPDPDTRARAIGRGAD